MTTFSSKRHAAAFTLVENLFATAIVGLCFIGLYSISTQALYHVNSGREAVSAKQGLSDRFEQIRGCSWAQVTNSNYLQTYVMNSSTSGEGRLGGVVETLTVNAYPTPYATPITLVRTKGATVVSSTNTNIANSDLARVDISLTWNAATGQRVRTQTRSTIVACSAP